jgi:hypothetical protein
VHPEAEDGAAPEPSEPPEPPKVPFWSRLGFDSFRAYMDELNRLQGPRDNEVPEVTLPGDEVGEIGGPQLFEQRLRQVNVKLRRSEAADLDRAAAIYGLAPTTLARLLVNRGVEAILGRYG